MRKLILGLGVVLAVAVSMVADQCARRLRPRTTVGVTLNEFKVTPAVQGAPAGKVTFTVTNSGKLEHEFVVVKTIRPAGSLAGQNGEASEAQAMSARSAR